jgi:hypothetical protein
MYKITYVSYVFTNDKGKEIEKIKDYSLVAETTEDARYNFLSKKIKHKYIKHISVDNANNLGNMFPELNNLKSKFN